MENSVTKKKKQNRYNKVNKSEIEMQKTETSKEVHFEKEKKKKKHKDIKKYEVNKVIWTKHSFIL